MYHFYATRQGTLDFELLKKQNEEIKAYLQFTSRSLKRENEEVKASLEDIKAMLAQEKEKEMVLEIKVEAKG